jgi:hypothetical protein
MDRESSLRLSIIKHGGVTASGGEKLHGSHDADGILLRECHPMSRRRSVSDSRNDRYAMLEILLMAQMMRSPLQTLARRWYCHGLFRATRGRRHCAECTRT